MKANVRLAIIPGISTRHLISIDAILQIIQMITCLSSYLCLHLSLQCTFVDTLRPGRDDTILFQLCAGPSVHVTRMTSVVCLLSFSSSLTIFGLHLTCVRMGAGRTWANYLVLFQLASCAFLMLICSSFLSADSYQTRIATATFILGFVSSLAYATNLAWKLYELRKS